MRWGQQFRFFRDEVIDSHATRRRDTDLEDKDVTDETEQVAE